MRKRIWIGAAALMIALAAASGMAVKSMLRAEGYAARLREVYDGAVLSALRRMEDMRLSLSKALLCGEERAAARYLSQVSAGAYEVQRSLSLLPLSHEATKNAVKFADQAADYSASLIRQGTLDGEDEKQLDSLIAACASSAEALADARESLSALAASGGSGFYPAEKDAESGFDSAVAYPALIYDGPFSDARQTGKAMALGAREISLQDALAIARDFVGAERVRRAYPGPEMGGSMPCWGISLELDGLTLQAAVTKQGGKILWMAPDTADFSPDKSVEECRESALRFLSRNGYENMQPTYFQVYQGVAVISFAATQGSTLLYPDLIKVQLRMDTAQVVGVEARNYLENHTARGLLTPALSLEEARDKVGERLRVSSARLCLIPTDGGEQLCYEFQGEFSGQTYLSYINAINGRQEQLLKVVEGETGLEAG